MNPVIKKRIHDAAQRFYKEAYKDGEDVSHKDIGEMLLGVAMNRLNEAGVSLEEVIMLLRKKAEN